MTQLRSIQTSPDYQKNSWTSDWQFKILNSKYVKAITLLYKYKKKLSFHGWDCGNVRPK